MVILIVFSKYYLYLLRISLFDHSQIQNKQIDYFSNESDVMNKYENPKFDSNFHCTLHTFPV